MTKTKQCTKCGETKPISDFGKRRDRADNRLRWECRACRAAHVRAWRAANPEWDRVQHLRRRFGLTPIDYDAMLVAQCGLCAICGEPERTIRHGKVVALAVDHDHATGTVRGLLCVRCNRMLGFMERNELLLTNARDYLGWAAAGRPPVVTSPA